MEIHLKVIGVLLIFLGLLHFAFPKYFKWQQELSSLSVINRQMMYVHSFFIAFTIILVGLLCLSSSSNLLTTTLGKRISLALAIFWTLRLVVQFFGYSSKIWKGKLFETIVHLVFSIFWTYLVVIFILTYLA